MESHQQTLWPAQHKIGLVGRLSFCHLQLWETPGQRRKNLGNFQAGQRRAQAVMRPSSKSQLPRRIFALPVQLSGLHKNLRVAVGGGQQQLRLGSGQQRLPGDFYILRQNPEIHLHG